MSSSLPRNMLCTYILMWFLYSPLNFDEEIKPERLQIIRECTGELDGLCDERESGNWMWRKKLCA